MISVAGVPPDYFNDNGQLWGMPLFNWKNMEEDGFRWWIKRLKKNLEWYDLIRLDHFRAFSAYWDVPADSETAIHGKWVKGPGRKLFDVIKQEFPNMPFVAEDLGEIDQPVYSLRDRYSLPGMKVIQFGFGSKMPFEEHNPINIPYNSIAYTGTHDNNTLLGWLQQDMDKKTKKRISRFINKKLYKNSFHLDMIRECYATKAKLAIVPMQDWLGLNESARMNFPSTIKGNWEWHMNKESMDKKLVKKILRFVKTFGRY
jgi:4-alpha-glucanotransferase